MASEGSTSPDLLVPPLDGEGSLRAGLEAHLRQSVRSGRLRPGARLPSSRALAARVGVSRRLVVEAYGQLVAEGYLAARQGSGTRVAARAAAPVRRERRRRRRAPEAPRFDLFPGAPDLTLFPRRAWLRATRAALAELPDRRLGYGPVHGAPELREALADHLGRVRGASVDPELVLVTAGYAQGLRVVGEALRARGVERVAVEDPGYPIAGNVLAAAGLEPLPVPVDAAGIDVGALAATGAGATLVTPAHQFPLGVVLASERRAALVAWARERDAVVVEDDYDAEIRYDREPVGTLQGLAPERVVLAGTASKTLAPGLRIGWLALPERLAEEALARKALHDLGGPVLEQVALARLLARGDLERHLRACRGRYRPKRAVLLAALAEHLPEASVTGVAAGLHAVVMLPAGTDEGAVVAAAARRGVRAYGLGLYRAVPRADEPGLVLGYAGHAEGELREAVALLAAAVRSVT